MRKMILEKDITVMYSDPESELTIEMADKAIAEIKTELELATMFAVVENKAWWIADEEYDFDEDTAEYRQAKEKREAWFSLAGKLRSRIFDILRAEGIEIPESGQIAVLSLFMNKYGIENAQGWWIKA